MRLGIAAAEICVRREEKKSGTTQKRVGGGGERERREEKSNNQVARRSKSFTGTETGEKVCWFDAYDKLYDMS